MLLLERDFTPAKPDFVVHQPNSLFSKLDTIAEEPCPCTRVSKAQSQNQPSAILNKLLMSNDLFSFNKNEATSSMACCDSHEKVHEETFLFELGPRPSHIDLTQQNPQPNNLPMLPFIFENIMKKQSLPGMPMKPKAVEIFFFPKKKEIEAGKFFPKVKEFKKSDIKVVGDKELRNDFKTYKYRPSFPITSFGKKTFTPDIIEETKPVKEVKIDETTEKTTGTTISTPNIVVN